MSNKVNLFQYSTEEILGTFKTKESRAGLVRVPSFWKSHCIICVPDRAKGPFLLTFFISVHYIFHDRQQILLKIKLIFQEIKSYQDVSKMSLNTDVSGV